MYGNRDHEYPYKPNRTTMGGGTIADIMDDNEAWETIPAKPEFPQCRKAKWRNMVALVWSDHPRQNKFTWTLSIEGKIPEATGRMTVVLRGIQTERRAQELAAFYMASIEPRVKFEGMQWPVGNDLDEDGE